MRIIINLTLTAVAVFFIAQYLPGFSVDSWQTAAWVAVALGLLNLFVRPILFILTLPITIITFGLFTYVLNAVILMMVPAFVTGITISGFVPALVASLIITAIRSLGGK